MRKIIKVNEFGPQSLIRWKVQTPHGTYQNITDLVRNDIKAECSKEQFYLCAYCCQRISGIAHDCMNEHVEARRISPQKSLDFTNIVSSCTTPNQCDNAHGSQALPLTPFMDECESELKFKLSGRVEGLSDRAAETIRVLNLGDTEQNNKSLIEKRKQLIYTLLFTNGVVPNEGLEDNDLIEMLINDICKPIDGKLEAFAPVTVNVLKQWIK